MTAQVLPQGKQSFETAAGLPAVGWKLYTTDTGTNNPRTTWQDSAQVTPNLNPIVLDARGEAVIFWSGAYRVRLEDNLGNTIWTVDGIAYLDPTATLLADLATFNNAAKGAAMVGFSPSISYSANSVGSFLNQVFGRTALEIAAAVTPTNYFYEPGDVRRYGAVGDGVADDTAAITSAFLPGHRVKSDRSLTHKITQVVISGKNFDFQTNNATFNLTGNSAGFLVNGTVTKGRVSGGYYNGDGVNRDAFPLTAQIAWTLGNTAAAQVSNIVIEDATATNCNVGFKLADGRGGGGTKTKNCRLSNCYAFNMVGQVGGMGYGFQFSQADGAEIVNCIAENCERHGIYFAEGKSYSASNCQVIGGGFGAVRGGFVVSRSANVTVNGIICRNRNDVGLVVDTDAAGLAPDNVCQDIVITGYQSLSNTLGDIKVGTDIPATDGTVSNLLIEGVVIRVSAGSTNNSIRITSGNNIVIKGLNIDASGAGASERAIRLTADDGAAFTTDVYVEIDHIKMTATGLGISVANALCVSSTNLYFNIKQVTSGAGEYEFSSGEDSVTNNSLLYRRSSGKSKRTYTASGAAITVPVGGITDFTFSASGATTVATFSGLQEDEEHTLFFTNGNTTLTNSASLLLAGGANFVGTANDTMRIARKGSLTVELSRSVN